MGVPLEEMDAVFGEGTYHVTVSLHNNLISFSFCTDAREEEIDNLESERASLVSGAIPTNSHLAINNNTSSGRDNSPSQRGWVSRLLRKGDGRAPYQPIADGEE